MRRSFSRLLLAVPPLHRITALGSALKCRLLAQMRSADCIEQCLSSEAKRKTYAHCEFFAV
jgi:hypothetical protein